MDLAFVPETCPIEGPLVAVDQCHVDAARRKLEGRADTGEAGAEDHHFSWMHHQEIRAAEPNARTREG